MDWLESSPPPSHTHPVSEVVDLQIELNTMQAQHDALGKEVDDLRNDIRGLMIAITILVGLVVVLCLALLLSVG